MSSAAFDDPRFDGFLFDSHCHFDFAAFDLQREQIWQQCVEQNISRMLIPGTEPAQWPVASNIARTHQGVVMSAGIHPWWVSAAGSRLPQDLSILDEPHCVAIGECGLDQAIDTPFERQVHIFEQHIHLAIERDMPLIVHVRQAHNDTIRLLKQYRPPKGGVIHGFSGSYELAKTYWQLGFYLGIGGSITYPRANKTREMVKAMPLESLVLETDAPDMPLYGFQGQANTPLKLIDVAQELSVLKSESLNIIAATTTHNAMSLFSVD